MNNVIELSPYQISEWKNRQPVDQPVRVRSIPPISREAPSVEIENQELIKQAPRLLASALKNGWARQLRSAEKVTGHIPNKNCITEETRARMSAAAKLRCANHQP